MITPPSLIKGSKLAIAAPARAVSEKEIEKAVRWLTDRGFEAVYDERLFRIHNQFAGTDEERASLMQEYIDSYDIDAILCARGGYGTVRIVDRLNFDSFQEHPKWIIGYSDVTVMHAKMQSLGYESLHATMPINFGENSEQSLESLYRAMTGGEMIYDIDNHHLNIFGDVEAELVGGNLSVLYSILGSDIFPDTYGKIMFIEDLDEYLYHIDRMMIALERAGKIRALKGIIVGGLTRIHDNTIRFGQSAEEIIAEKAAAYGIPLCIGFPAGHIEDNRALIMGRRVRLAVGEDKVRIEFKR